MEPTIFFIGIIYIVIAVLGIILFFKVWGMCNNVSKINARQENASPDDMDFALLICDDTTARRQAIIKFVKEILPLYKECVDEYTCDDRRKYLNEIMDAKFQQFNKFFHDLALGETPESLKSRAAFTSRIKKIHGINSNENNPTIK